MEISDTLDPARAVAFHATLGLQGPVPQANDSLPPFWHYIYFWDVRPQEQLGQDGHPKTGGFIPDLGLPRRMWAGGDLQFHAPLRIGVPATKISKVVDVSKKTGSTGPLAIVTVDHQIRQDGKLCLSEKQSLIYRAAAHPHAPHPRPPVAPKNEVFSETYTFTSTQLFRYSALTFNGHRIHYDQEYARTQEGYPDLIVHGPLLAQLLIGLAETYLGKLKGFTFKATSPLFVAETAALCAKPNENGLDLWVRGSNDKLSMTAKAF
jgi:3-methylfumaryl-CoA hydratase